MEAVWQCNQQRLVENLISKGVRGIALTGCWERDNSVFWRRIKGPSLQEPRGDSGNWYGTQHHQTNWCSFSQEIIRKLSPALGKTSNSALQTLSKQGWAGIPVPGHSQEWRPLIPFPNFGNGFFSFPSRSRISGMDFFHSLPVPEFWECFFSIPFPFPNFGNGIIHSRSRSRTPKCHSRLPLEWSHQQWRG